MKSIHPLLKCLLLLIAFSNLAQAFYDPGHGRWLSRDPIDERGGDNLYVFVDNNCISLTDRLGLYTIQEAVGSLKTKGVVPAGNPNPLNPAGTGNDYSDTQKFDEWLLLESGDTSWLSSLPDCPDKICVKDGKPQNCDSSQWGSLTTAGGLHEGSDYCMRSKGGPSGQQCCYSLSEDGKSLELETSLPSAGTPDRVAATAANGLFTGHYSHDVEPYEFAQRLNRIGAYGQARPPNQGGGTCN